ncbi:MAG: class I SAM-dependent methyltransferase, partial [Gammaproteobacteria bacterium]|nr:class I SAM-dependent methyltransferase [Gammaproteobacteria bacterium]
AMDSSSVGIAKAEELARANNLDIEYQLADAKTWGWPANTYDLVVAIFIQFAGPEFRQQIFEDMIKTLKPGGILLLHGYTPRQLDYGTGGPSAVANLYTKDILLEAFSDLELLRLEEYDCELQEGTGHSGMSALIDLVARKQP